MRYASRKRCECRSLFCFGLPTGGYGRVCVYFSDYEGERHRPVSGSRKGNSKEVSEDHICGACEPEYDGELQKLVDDKTVIYHGLVKDVATIHKVTHCTVHPTYYPEGMSNVLLEACASGRPIITTDRAGCREIIDDCVNVFVVKQKDSEDLIDKLERFINLPYEQKKAMGLAARSKVEKEFDRQIVVRKYLDELTRMSSIRLSKNRR